MAKKNILVVDDAKVVGSAFRKELGEEGYDVDCALSGDEALEMIKAKKYDLIFVDLVMPGKNGIETCKAIKKASPASMQVFMTGKLDTETITKELEFLHAGGKVFCLCKPFNEGELITVTKKVLGQI